MLLLLGLGLLAGAPGPGLPALLCGWFVFGVGAALVQTPAGELLRISCRPADRPAFFSAHFALSHAAWLVAYPLAGWLGGAVGFEGTCLALALVALACGGAAARSWPRRDAIELEHEHPPLDHEHPHVHDEHHAHEHAGWEGPEPHTHPHRHAPLRHRHAFVVDLHHPRFPA